MSDLERFQKQHGADWSNVVRSPVFASAMTLLNLEKIGRIAELTDEEIATKGHIILADLRGHLKHENALLGLHEIKKLVFQQLPSEQYPNPAEEAHEEAEQEEARSEDESDERQSSFPVTPPAVVAAPVVKKKKLPPKKKPRKIRAKR